MRIISVDGKYFLDGKFCEENGVGDSNVYVLYNDVVYYNVTPEEISLICAKMKITFAILDDPNMQIYAVIPDEDPDQEFLVYTKGNSCFVEQKILQQFHLNPKSDTINVEGTLYYEVTPEQLSIVEGSSIYGIWKANYKKIEA